MPRPVEELVALFPAIRNKLVCWTLTKPSGLLFTLLPVQQTEHSVVQGINRRYLIDTWKIDSICISPQKWCCQSLSAMQDAYSSPPPSDLIQSHFPNVNESIILLLLVFVESSLGLSSCPCKQLIISLKCKKGVHIIPTCQFYFWLKEIRKEKYVYSDKYCRK